MRISDVLARLQPEFPAITHSKLRFLEDQGLIEPVRTPAGYRHYSAADIERLRYVLTAQRDRYLPLKVIKDTLEELDRGIGSMDPPPAPPTTTPPDPDPDLSDQDIEVDRAVLTGLIDAGLIRPTRGDSLDPTALQIAQIATILAGYGIEARHLRSLRTASDRHIGLIEQVIAPWARGQSDTARAHAHAMADQVEGLLTQLHTLWVRQAITDLTT